MESETQKSIWNIDGAEMYAIFEIKTKFIECFLDWDLEGSYWAVRTLRMELDPKFKRSEKKIIQESQSEEQKKKRTEKERVDDLLKELTGIREEFCKFKDPPNEEKSKFYFALEEFYLHLCRLMKEHGMYFREGEDRRIAVLRR